MTEVVYNSKLTHYPRKRAAPMIDVPPPNSWDANSVRRLIVILLLGGAVFGGFVAWEVNNRIHNDDVCDYVTEMYKVANDDAYRTRVFNTGNDSTEWEYLKDIYGKDAASEIMDARWSGTALPSAFMAGAVIDACGEAPPSN